MIIVLFFESQSCSILDQRKHVRFIYFLLKMILSSTLIFLLFVLVASIGSCVNSTGIGKDTTQPSQQETGQPSQQLQLGPQQLPHIIQSPLHLNHLSHPAWQFPQHAQLSPYIQHQFQPQHHDLPMPIDMQNIVPQPAPSTHLPQPKGQNHVVPIDDALRQLMKEDVDDASVNHIDIGDWENVLKSTPAAEPDPKVGVILSTEAKGKAVAHDQSHEIMWNSRVPHNEVAIDPKILEKLDPNQTDDKLKKYFVYYRKEPIGEQKGKEMAKCRICDKIYKRTSTSGQAKHLRTHTELWKMYDNARKQIKLKKLQKMAPDRLVLIDTKEYAKLNTEKPEYLLEKYFDYYTTESKGELKGKQKARCRICEAELSRKRGTTGSISGHLMLRHEEFYKLFEDAQQKVNPQNKRFLQGASSASMDPDAYKLMNKNRRKYSLQKYFDYKPADKTAKCRICNEQVERTSGKINSLTDHLKEQHEEFFKIYDSAKRKEKLKKQQKKRRLDDNYDDEEIYGEKEQPNASQSQPIMISFTDPVNLSKKPRKN